MKTCSVTTVLDAPAEVVWSGVKTPHAFVHVARGLVRFPAAERVDGPWRVGTEITGWTFLFGFLPFSVHTLRVESIDEKTMTLVSDEEGGLLRMWRHELITTPIDEHSCHYEDRIEIDAGILTPLVVAYAKLFYRGRQRRWRKLAPMLAAVETAEADRELAMAS